MSVVSSSLTFITLRTEVKLSVNHYSILVCLGWSLNPYRSASEYKLPTVQARTRSDKPESGGAAMQHTCPEGGGCPPHSGAGCILKTLLCSGRAGHSSSGSESVRFCGWSLSLWGEPLWTGLVNLGWGGLWSAAEFLFLKSWRTSFWPDSPAGLNSLVRRNFSSDIKFRANTDLASFMGINVAVYQIFWTFRSGVCPPPSDPWCLLEQKWSHVSLK